MHRLHPKGISPTIPKNPIDNHEAYTVRKTKK